MNPNIFRMYDIRGIAEKDLNDEIVELIGKAYGTFMIRKQYRLISVGRDLRLSSDRIQKALVQGIRSTGIDVIDVGVLPTPALYFSIVHLNTDGAVMVTGSHNPIEFNGIKMNERLLSIYGEDIQRIKQLIEIKDFAQGSGTLAEREIVSVYKKMLKEKIQLNRTFKIVIDAGNATAGPIAPEIYESLGCEVIQLYCEPDGNFPNHLPDPTVMEYIEDLRKTVVRGKADFGLGYDGDSDRVGVIDEKGRPVYADKILALLSREVLSRNPGSKIIFDVKCSQMLPEEIKKAGGEPLMWMTGHSLIKKKMKEENAPIAGEMSGHIFFKDGYFGFDDGIYVSLRLVQLLSSQDKTLGQLVDALPQFVTTPEIRITCPDEDKFEVIRKLVGDFKKNYKVIDVDGARVEFGDGWGLVRASNTQPKLVLRFEAKTADRLNTIKDLFKQRLSKFPMIDLSELGD